VAGNKLYTTAAAIFTIAASISGAQAAPPQGSSQNPQSASVSSYHDAISRIDAEILLLNKQNELRNAQRLANPPGRTDADIGVSLPRIINIVTSGTVTTARVSYDSGLVRDIRVGDDIGGGARVHSITESSVSVRVRGKTENLSFLGMPSSVAPSLAGGPMMMPPSAPPSMPPSAPPPVFSSPGM